MRWANLTPSKYILEAISDADSAAGVAQATLFQPNVPTAVLSAAHKSGKSRNAQTSKKEWSKSFADQMAKRLAIKMDATRRKSEFKRFYSLCSVSPIDKERAEPFVALGDDRKQVDIILRNDLAGLQIGISLKGVGFPDSWKKGRPANFGKNLTGRLYELGDETDVVHRNLPRCLMVCVYYLPLEAVQDKSPSTFHSVAEKLMRRTGRTDYYDSAQFRRIDLSFIALYGNRDYSAVPGLSGIKSGVVRYFPVSEKLPARHGLPVVADTIDAEEMMTRILRQRLPSSLELLNSEPDVAKHGS